MQVLGSPSIGSLFCSYFCNRVDRRLFLDENGEIF